MDHYEDILSNYLVKLSSHQISDNDSITISKLLKAIGDFERISDHSVNILEFAEEIAEKEIRFTATAKKELDILCGAVSETLSLCYLSFVKNDSEMARNVEPLEQVIDELKETMRNHHISRLKSSECSLEAGFVWLDLLTNLERTSDHCSNIAVGVIDAADNNVNMHESLRNMRKNDAYFEKKYAEFAKKYLIANLG